MYRIIFTVLILLTSCFHSSGSSSNKSGLQLSSITFIDKNGLSETITEKEKLKPFLTYDFLGAQPYQKVLRVFARDTKGKIRSIATSYHANGGVRQYLEIENGRAHGKYIEWYPSGSKHLEANIIEGKADLDTGSMATWAFDGLSYAYREDGTIEAKFPYSKGLLDGEVLRFAPDGTIASKAHFKNGLKMGKEEKFFSPDNPSEILNYKDGYLHGEAFGFYEDKKPLWIEFWDDGFIQKGEYFLPDGSIICSINDGTGKKAIFTDGKLTQTREYNHGEEDGEVLIFDNHGKIQARYTLKNGKKQGFEIKYFPAKGKKEPKPKLQIEWYNGMLQGTVKSYYPTGSIESQREYISNYKQGLSTAWYSDGSVMLIEEYEKDRLVRGEYRRRGEKNPISQVQNGKGTATLFDGNGALIQRIRYNEGLPQE